LELHEAENECDQQLASLGVRQSPCSSQSTGKSLRFEEIEMVTDPVCGMVVDEEEAQFKSLFAGKKYFFCSEDCRREFEDHREEYFETAA
jgi:YHS domain-containing protein